METLSLIPQSPPLPLFLVFFSDFCLADNTNHIENSDSDYLLSSYCSFFFPLKEADIRIIAFFKTWICLLEIPD